MKTLTKAQRKALGRVYARTLTFDEPSTLSYKQFRKTVEPGWDCIMVPFGSMWLGIENDGYTHS